MADPYFTRSKARRAQQDAQAVPNMDARGLGFYLSNHQNLDDLRHEQIICTVEGDPNDENFFIIVKWKIYSFPDDGQESAEGWVNVTCIDQAKSPRSMRLVAGQNKLWFFLPKGFEDKELPIKGFDASQMTNIKPPPSELETDVPKVALQQLQTGPTSSLLLQQRFSITEERIFNTVDLMQRVGCSPIIADTVKEKFTEVLYANFNNFQIVVGHIEDKKSSRSDLQNMWANYVNVWEQDSERLSSFVNRECSSITPTDIIQSIKASLDTLKTNLGLAKHGIDHILHNLLSDSDATAADDDSIPEKSFALEAEANPTAPSTGININDSDGLPSYQDFLTSSKKAEMLSEGRLSPSGVEPPSEPPVADMDISVMPEEVDRGLSKMKHLPQTVDNPPTHSTPDQHIYQNVKIYPDIGVSALQVQMQGAELQAGIRSIKTENEKLKQQLSEQRSKIEKEVSDRMFADLQRERALYQDRMQAMEQEKGLYEAKVQELVLAQQQAEQRFLAQNIAKQKDVNDQIRETVKQQVAQAVEAAVHDATYDYKNKIRTYEDAVLELRKQNREAMSVREDLASKLSQLQLEGNSLRDQAREATLKAEEQEERRKSEQKRLKQEYEDKERMRLRVEERLALAESERNALQQEIESFRANAAATRSHGNLGPAATTDNRRDDGAYFRTSPPGEPFHRSSSCNTSHRKSNSRADNATAGSGDGTRFTEASRARSAGGFTQVRFGLEDNDQPSDDDGSSADMRNSFAFGSHNERTSRYYSRAGTQEHDTKYEFQIAIQTIEDNTRRLKKLLPSGYQDVTTLDNNTIYRLSKGTCKGAKLSETVDTAIREVRSHRLLLFKYNSPPAVLHEELRTQVELFDLWVSRVEKFDLDFVRFQESVCGTGQIGAEDITKALSPFDDSVPYMHIFSWKRKLQKLFADSSTHYQQRGQFVLDRMLSPPIATYVRGKLKDTASPQIEHMKDSFSL